MATTTATINEKFVLNYKNSYDFCTNNEINENEKQQQLKQHQQRQQQILEQPSWYTKIKTKIKTNMSPPNTKAIMKTTKQKQKPKMKTVVSLSLPIVEANSVEKSLIKKICIICRRELILECENDASAETAFCCVLQQQQQQQEKEEDERHIKSGSYATRATTTTTTMQTNKNNLNKMCSAAATATANTTITTFRNNCRNNNSIVATTTTTTTKTTTEETRESRNVCCCTKCQVECISKSKLINSNVDDTAHNRQKQQQQQQQQQSCATNQIINNLDIATATNTKNIQPTIMAATTTTEEEESYNSNNKIENNTNQSIRTFISKAIRLNLNYNDYYNKFKNRQNQIEEQQHATQKNSTTTTTAAAKNQQQQSFVVNENFSIYQQMPKMNWQTTTTATTATTIKSSRKRRQQNAEQQQRAKTQKCLTILALFMLNVINTTTTVYAHRTTTATTASGLKSSQQLRIQQNDDAFSASLAALEMPIPATPILTESRTGTATATKFKRSITSGTKMKTITTEQSMKQLKLTHSEKLCKSMDIRNDVSSFDHLENCTVIEGFLLISLISNCHLLNKTFPLLTEITEFIIIYRTEGLHSLSQIFPNLSIIRGTSVFDGYSLVIYQNRDLQDIGLTKLRAIAHGGVRIEKNLSLCYLHTIDWEKIVAANTTEILFKDNRADEECPKCPGDNMNGETQDSSVGGAGGDAANALVCKESSGRRRCWSSKACQIICPERCRHNCIDENTCCNEACLGGCVMEGNKETCIGCRHYSIHNSTCVEKCPKDYYSYLDRRCITAETCELIGTKFENTKDVTLVHYDGQCSTRCPQNYTKVNSTCEPCGDECERKCDGGVIDSFMRAKVYHGCTEIGKSGLIINIKRGGPHLMSELEYGLESIHTIRTYLKVHLTFGLISLSFFKRLREIKGEVLLENRYSLYVLENNDLESLWAPNQTVKITNGSVFFHFNPKLCYSVIDELRGMMASKPTEFSKNEVAMDSNGNRGSCNTETLYTSVSKIFTYGAIVVITNPLQFGDDRTFIGYQFFVIEDPYRNATKYSYKPCDDNWLASEPTKRTDYLFTNLESYKTYAYYVKTMTISSEPRNAQSDIVHFRTRPSKPTYVQRLKAVANSSSEIVITWKPPANAYGNLTSYVVRAVISNRNENLGTRNYCKEPFKEETQFVLKTEKPITDPICNCDVDGNPKKPSSDRYDPSELEGSFQDEIEFENTLQNYIYVKQSNPKVPSNDVMTGGAVTQRLKKRSLDGSHIEDSGDNDMSSFLMRHIRDISNDSQDRSDWNALPMTKWPPNQDPKSWITEKMDEHDEYYMEFVASVNVSTNEFVFKKLKHFSMYTLAVVACREREVEDKNDICSEVMLIDKRTGKLDNVDKVEDLRGVLELTNSTRSNVRLFWKPPLRPNGAVVSYTISYEKQGPYEVEDHKCITEQEYRNLTNGYPLTGLQEGNYSIRVRANTQAGEGIYTKPIYVNVPSGMMSIWAIAGLVIVGLLTVSALGGFMGYYIRKKRPPSDLTMNPTVNPFYMSVQYIPDEWEVPRERIIQLSPLGQGSFGMVYEGILKGYLNNEDTPCAIKTVNENSTDRERMNFLNEASVMKQFDTYHVVRLLGVVSHGQPALVVMELMKNGDLKSYLRAHRPEEREMNQPPPLSRIYQMAIEIADGMAYLAAKKFVHRDLAARNCMVAEDLTVKIGDFGMTRDIYQNDYYRKGTKGLLPVRWMPPESLRDGVYASSSDVFSYGVVLWEMVTLASQPYQGLTNDQVLHYVIDGGVMERPENCPDLLYLLMQKCWHHRPSARPTFLEIINMLQDMAAPHFREVSFYHSEEGQTVLTKELSEKKQHTSDAYNDGDNELEDATTPLRVCEFHAYKSNMDNNSSVDNQGESPIIAEEEHPNSPYSLQSAFVVCSTPDRQSKNSYNLSHNNPYAISAPTTSVSAVAGSNLQQQQQQQQQQQVRPYYGRMAALVNQDDTDAAAYVLPDSDVIAAAAGQEQVQDTDDRGYEMYDPSPNYHKVPTYETSDLDDLPIGSKMSGEQHLLPRAKGQRMPSILPMSSSMPDDVISGTPMPSSLHPSTASAASSNASSSVGATGRFPSLKRAVADTLKQSRLRNIKGSLFNHKRSGSNTSHKSTSSNPSTFATVGGGPTSSSNTNLTGTASGTANSQNLGTIESGGSGSSSGWAGALHFLKPGTAAPSSVSDNPNYKLLHESANVSDFSTEPPPSASKKQTKPNSPANSGTSYQQLDESQNTTGTPSMLTTSENPNYASMQPPAMSESSARGDAPSILMMLMGNPKSGNASTPTNQPTVAATTPATLPNISENPNYQIMGPSPAIPTTNRSALAAFTSALRREPSAERLDNSSTSTSGASSQSENSDIDDNDGDGKPTEKFKMNRWSVDAPLRAAGDSKRKTRKSSKPRSAVSDKSTPTTTTAATDAAQQQASGQPRHASNTFTLKENWLRQPQPRPPPPNGFIGREA